MPPDTAQASKINIDPDLIPDRIRSDIGAVLFKEFQKNIRDPTKKQHYKELGRAFMQRMATETQKGGETQ